MEHRLPTEDALLEAALISLDELGWADRSDGVRVEGVDPFFVEWVTRPPIAGPHLAAELVAGRVRAHERLQTARAGWTSDHPCWVPGVMPLVTADRWPAVARAAVLGLPVEEIRA